MAFSDLSLLGFLKSKMHWHQARQQLLAQNVANADTPSYRPQDLAPMKFEAALASRTPQGVFMARTSAMHIAGAANGAAASGHKATSDFGWERTPGGNAVVLEEEMMKVAANQFDYQLASNLYSKSIGLLKSALGRTG